MVTHEFTDEGISGSLGPEKRPGLAAMLDAIESKEIDTVIFASLDRLARKASLLLSLTDSFKEKGITFVFCREMMDTSTPMGEAMVGLIAVFAQLESALITERCTAGRDARGKVDGEKGGRMPLGYQRSENGIVVVDAEAAIVRQIFKARREGLIMQAIADLLNGQGLVSKQGGRWYPTTVKIILDKKDYYEGGLRGYSPVFWPRILE